jgi:hypothetical protein
VAPKFYPIISSTKCDPCRGRSETHLIQSGREGACDIRAVQELPGHKDVRTTMICTHVLNRGGGREEPSEQLVTKKAARVLPKPYRTPDWGEMRLNPLIKTVLREDESSLLSVCKTLV